MSKRKRGEQKLMRGRDQLEPRSSSTAELIHDTLAGKAGAKANDATTNDGGTQSEHS
jgi:hypothetical protein